MALTFDRRTLLRVLELAVALLLADYVSAILVPLAGSVGIDLPNMPLLRHTYLLFGFFVLLAVWLRYRGEPLSDFGLVVPAHWLRYLWQGAAIFLVVMTFDILVRPMLDSFVAGVTGTSKTLAEQHFASVRGNLGMVLYLIPFGWIFGGLGEEFFYRGYVMRRAAQILGEGRAAWIVALVFQAALFGLGHAYQGPVGVVAIFLGALITGTGYLLCGRVLWPVIIAHGLQDTVGFLALYAGIAHA